MVTIKERIESLEKEHGSLRAVSRNLGIDVAYLKRLRDGQKNSPSDKIIELLGLTKKVIYELS